MKAKCNKKIKKNIFWTPSRITYCTVFLTLFSICGACTLSFISSIIPQEISVAPTSLPWIKSEIDCDNTAGRVWSENQCWDSEHGITF